MIERREADKVTIPEFPKIDGLVAWKTDVMYRVTTASGNPNLSRVSQWVTRSWNGTATLEATYDYGGDLFAALGFKKRPGGIALEHTVV